MIETEKAGTKEGICAIYIPSTLLGQIADRAQASRIDIPSLLHRLIIAHSPPELPPVQRLVAAIGEANMATIEARAQSRGISPDAYFAYLLELNAPAPNLIELCTEARTDR